MTAPRQEPSTKRDITGLGWGERQLARRPSPGGGPVAWMAVYDDVDFGQQINNANAAGETVLLYPRIEMSDNYAAFFSWTATADTELGSDWDYGVEIMADGIFSITLDAATENLTGVEFKTILRPGIGARPPGYGVAPQIMVQTMDDATNFATAYRYWNSTWVIPLKLISAPDVIQPTIQFIKTSGGGDFNVEVYSRMYVCYLGPLNHAAAMRVGNDPGPP